MAFRFIPKDWFPDEKLIAWTKAKGLSDTQIEQMVEDIKDHQYKRPMMREDACWRNWVKRAIKWEHVTPTVQREYRRPQELSDAQRQADILAFENDPLLRAARRAKQ